MKKRILMMCAWCMLAMMSAAHAQDDAEMMQSVWQVLRAGRPVERVMATDHLAVYCQQGGGFAVVTADDQVPRLLAYSPTAPFSVNDGNSGFGWWLRMVQKVGGRANAPTPPDPDRYAVRVDSLLTTLWGQSSPFNAWCPTAEGEICNDYAPDVDHCDVGCVATAIAQIVHYYRYPAQASGECDFAIGDQSSHTSFSGTYDWDNMLDFYKNGYTEEQGRAVAQLCYHCGLISRMNYGTNASGSSNQNAINGLVQYFGYSDEMHYVVRSDYSEQQWMEMIYDELTHGRPILYTGVEVNFVQGIVGGHSFVIDGYDENGLVHVNWGWQGRANGYYDVALLNPLIYDFVDYQDMVLGFVPARQTVTGDVTGDGLVDIADVNAVINAMLGKAPQTAESDVTGDGTVDIADVNTVINLMLGK
ncbi:MAG: C10 family peptidase [Muribaculaceae bacterium]|nr:C10 family peptidase [Muribaculaceae bacterium]